ncbi:MAG TPA: hypothetical protein VGE26_01565 [Sphingobacteriaceae bacterium]
MKTHFSSPQDNLSLLIDAERKKISLALNESNAHYKDLISIVRQFDLFYLSVNSNGEPDSAQATRMLEFYRHGWYDAFAFYVPKLDNITSPIAFPAIHAAQQWADSVLGVCGKINIAGRLLDLSKVGLLGIEQLSGRQFMTRFKHEIGEKEHFDRSSFDFVKKLALIPVKERHDLHQQRYAGIKNRLGDIIQNPKGKYISYRATAEIEDFYADAGYFHVLSQQGYEDFGEDDLFGGVPYRAYLDCIQNICSAVLLHIDCCIKLIEKNPGVNPYDIVTYNWYLNKTENGYAEHFGFPIEKIQQIISCLTLSSENIGFYKHLQGALPPPYIKTGVNQICRSVYGSLHGAIDFLKRELKRRYENDYFAAVNKREKRFRNDLYNFFPGDRFIRIDKEIVLKYGGLHTDIDGVVYDAITGSLGLFQLKWQDMFYTSLTERYSRISNLFPKASEWIDKIERWISGISEQELVRKLKLDENKKDTKIGEIYLFVIARNHVHFTGVEPDQRAAWASMNQIPFSLARIKTLFDDPIRELHFKLKFDSPEERVKREGFPKRGNYEIELESFTIG